jgi:amidase
MIRFTTQLALLFTAASATAQQTADSAFRVEEATIADLHAAFADGRLTCQGLVQRYLDRIDA